MLFLPLILPLLYAEMQPIAQILAEQEAKQEGVYISEKTDHEAQQGVACSCVAFVRQYRPDIPSMDASMFTPATTTPREGAVALMHYPHSGAWHLALVLSVEGDSLVIRDANYVSCTVTERRITLPDRVVGYL